MIQRRTGGTGCALDNLHKSVDFYQGIECMFPYWNSDLLDLLIKILIQISNLFHISQRIGDKAQRYQFHGPAREGRTDCRISFPENFKPGYFIIKRSFKLLNRDNGYLG